MMLHKETAIRHYEEMKTELKVCEIGGLFLAICKNEQNQKLIISELQKDIPGYNHVEKEMKDKEIEIAFPVLFSKIDMQANKRYIFHVLKIESLKEESKNKFIQSLERNRELFKSGNYSIIFWVTHQFVNDLYRKAPNFHHWVFGNYDFTGIEIHNQLNGHLIYHETKMVDITIDNCFKKMYQLLASCMEELIIV